MRRKVKSSTQDFIQRSQSQYGNEFGYDRVVYVNAREKVELLHNKCGQYMFITPDSHLRKPRCAVCAGNKVLNTARFIEICSVVHNNEYTYDEVKYVNNSTEVKIYHTVCQKFIMVSPAVHMKGHRCIYCFGTPLKSLETFISQANEVHDSSYSYEKCIYINDTEKVIVIHNDCKKEFTVSPSNHLQGKKCPHCYGTPRKTTEEFIRRSQLAHPGEYEYKDCEYKNNHTKVKVHHKKCGRDIMVIPLQHVNGVRCGFCYLSKMKIKEQFIEQAFIVHQGLYNYDSVVYKGSKKNVTIYCNLCNLYFDQTPSGHCSGRGCIYHVNKTEKKLHEWLLKHDFNVRREEKFATLLKNNSRFDFYLEDLDLIIELDGKQHFEPIKKWKSDPKVNQEKDKAKMQFCYEYGLTVIRISQEDVASIKYNWQSKLLPLIKKHNKPTVYMLSKKKNLYDPYKQFVSDLLENKFPHKF